MTRCSGGRGIPDHDAKHIGARIEIPWRPDQGPVRVLVMHRCETYGCPHFLQDREEAARDAEAVLRKVLAPRGMLGCRHDAPGRREVGAFVSLRDDLFLRRLGADGSAARPTGPSG